jgi:hypothetical protein
MRIEGIALLGAMIAAVTMTACAVATAGPACGGNCKSTEACVEVNGTACATLCQQDAGTAQNDAGVCPKTTTCQEAVTHYCTPQPCADTTVDVCL